MQQTYEPPLKKSKFKRFLKWTFIVIAILFTVAAIDFGRYYFKVMEQHEKARTALSEINRVQHTPRDVVGNLGGVPVTIPARMAVLVEYNDSPGWSGQKREGPIPERTHESVLMSFGVDFRYPDMLTLNMPGGYKDYKSKTPSRIDWIGFGVSAGKSYPTSHDWMKSSINGIRDFEQSGESPYFYENQKETPFGLEKYLEIKKSTMRHEPERAGTMAINYIGKNEEGEPIAIFYCANVLRGSCVHKFGMEKYGMKAIIRVSYRNEQLKNWRDIQQKVTELVLTWRVSLDHQSEIKANQPN